MPWDGMPSREDSGDEGGGRKMPAGAERGGDESKCRRTGCRVGRISCLPSNVEESNKHKQAMD